MKMHVRIQWLSWAESFTETAKPLFIGSIPIAASKSRQKDLVTGGLRMRLQQVSSFLISA